MVDDSDSWDWDRFAIRDDRDRWRNYPFTDYFDVGLGGSEGTAALSALFIFLNSVAGFLGASVFHIEFSQQLRILLPLTVAGGALGAYLGAQKFSPKVLKYLLAFVLAFAAVKLIIG